MSPRTHQCPFGPTSRFEKALELKAHWKSSFGPKIGMDICDVNKMEPVKPFQILLKNGKNLLTLSKKKSSQSRYGFGWKR